MEKTTLGFRIYKIWQILKRFAGTFRQAQTLKLWGVITIGKFKLNINNVHTEGPRTVRFHLMLSRSSVVWIMIRGPKNLHINLFKIITLLQRIFCKETCKALFSHSVVIFPGPIMHIMRGLSVNTYLLSNYSLNINNDKKKVINDNPITNRAIRNDSNENANGVAIPETRTIQLEAMKLVYLP